MVDVRHRDPGADDHLVDGGHQFFRTIPPLAIIPLAIVTMGIDE
jgi:ABC-type nitrate/sulfonate/bicarbonate transport system permease component